MLNHFCRVEQNAFQNDKQGLSDRKKVREMAEDYAYLLDQKIVTDSDLLKAISISLKTNTSVETTLINYFKVPKAAIGKSLASFHGCKFIPDNPQMPVPVDVFTDLDKSLLLKGCWVPLSWDENGIVVLVDDPSDTEKQVTIKSELRTEWVIFAVGIKEDIEAIIHRSFCQLETDDFIEALISKKKPIDVTKLVNILISEAYRNGAADIHFQWSQAPAENLVQFRIDDVLQDYMSVSDAVADDIVLRIKSMAKFNVEDSKLHKVGYIKFRRDGLPEFRVTVTMRPNAGSREEVVLKIPNPEDRS